MTPPGIVPSSVGYHTSSAKTPAFNHAFSWRGKPGLVLTLFNKAVWSILSKHLAISASKPYLALWAMAVKIASIAS